MPKADVYQESFSGGEFSPLIQGRVKADRYLTGLALCLNSVPVLQGPLVRRPGSYFAAETKTSTKASRLHRFEFSTTQAYMLEFGDLYIRFYRNGGQIVETALVITGITQANPAVVTSVAHGLSNGQEVFITGVLGMTQVNGRNFKVAGVTADTFQLVDMDLTTNINSTGYTAYSSAGSAARVYTVASPYLEAHLFQLNFVQSVDTLYIFHPLYAPRKLTRTAHTTWTLSVISFIDGPYLPTNTTATTFTSNGASGAVTITASVATFVATDVGRLIRVFLNSTWSWLEITAFTDTTHVIATVKGPNIAAAATALWRLGVWSVTTGYPATAVFHEDRLSPAGCTNYPQRVDMSVTGDYENFGPTALDGTGTITNANALNFQFNSNDVNVIRWEVSSEKGLLAGTVGGEWAVRPSVQGEALSPTNISAKQVSAWGCANIQPVVIGNAVIFIQRSTKRAREVSYYYYEDSFRSPDRTKLADHIAGTGFKQLAIQKHPHSLVWAARNDGVLACMTYEKEDDNLIVAWHRHVIGGYSDAAGSDAQVESCAVIPSSDGTRDELWLIVKRYINGRVVRYVEYLTKFFDELTEQKDAFYVDCGLTYDNPITISAGTRANPCVITANAHGFSNGDQVIISDVLGLKNGTVSGVNGQYFRVRNVAANTFELEDMHGVAVNSTSWTVYVSSGKVRKFVSTISPLWHLEGQTVSILGDGAPQTPQVIANGILTLPSHAATVQIGFPETSEGQLLRPEAGSATGTSIGKTRRPEKCTFNLHRSLGLSVGVDLDNLNPVVFRTTADAASAAPALFTGLEEIELDSGYDTEGQVCWRTSDPLPLTIRGITTKMHTEDAQ